MKKYFLLLMSTIIFLSPLYGQIVPNGGFENWTAGNPDNWITSNQPPLYVVVTPSTSAHSGTYAATGHVASYFGTIDSPLLAVGTNGKGFPISQRYTNFSGYYQFSPVMGDRLNVTVLLTKNNVGQAGQSVYLAPATTYTPFNISIIYGYPDVPDTCYILITIVKPDSGGTPHSGSSFLIDDLNLSDNSTTVNDPTSFPTKYTLEQNYPNPFNPGTKIEFNLPEKSYVTLTVYNTIGEKVVSVIDGVLPEGTHNVSFNAANLYSGVYFYTLKAGNKFIQTKKMILLK